MLITDLNPSEGIGASGWMVEMDDFRILMDAGINPKLIGHASLPLLLYFYTKQIHHFSESQLSVLELVQVEKLQFLLCTLLRVS